jgi:hypothetical protein
MPARGFAVARRSRQGTDFYQGDFMRRIITRIGVALTLVVCAACAEKTEGPAGTPTATPELTAAATSTAAAPTATAAAAASAAPTEAPSAAPTAAPADTAAAAGTGTASAVAAASGAPAAGSAAPAASGSAAAGPKTFDCGAKGQKLCPMQAWMKGAMASASSSGDGEKLANALAYCGGKPPPGMSQWASISATGASKAKAGDIEGAKATCKQCHDLYKQKYQTTMRDRPW